MNQRVPIQTLGEQIIGIIQTVGSIVAVAILFVIVIKYIISTKEEKGEYKKVLLPYIIGAILLFVFSNFVYIYNKIINIL